MHNIKHTLYQVGEKYISKLIKILKCYCDTHYKLIKCSSKNLYKHRRFAHGSLKGPHNSFFYIMRENFYNSNYGKNAHV